LHKQKKVTSYDVAREAGVSQSAVSRVFRPGFSVSKKTREKVITTANKMGYRPNAIARMLITKKSGMVAVIISSLANVNYPEVLSQLNNYLSIQHKRVLLFTLDDAEEIEELLNNILTFQVDGVIALAAHFENNILEQFAQHQVPVVLYNRNVPNSNANTVCCNHDKGIKQLIDLLIEHGHKSYLIIAGPKDSDVANERRVIAESHLKYSGFDDVPVVYGDFSYESGRETFAQWSKNNPIPDAIICSNDIMAIGVIDEAKENLNLSVPDDISVVGFDGVSASNWFNYQLTTVKQPLEQLTKAAVDILMERIDNPGSASESRVLSGTLIKGNSIKHRTQ
jgi:DNA-binding LacI/PurR family transcriptional regulator